MTVPPQEKGSALLTVLLLVAVMATIAATALDRISVGTRLASNVAEVGQARAWLEVAELVATTRIEDLLESNPSQTTLAGGWMGADRSIALPNGATVTARMDDGGNCFNLNSLVEEQLGGQLVGRPLAQRQFTVLMLALGIGEGDADRVAASASDYIDSDSSPLPGGAEVGWGGTAPLSANRLMADSSELRAVPGVSNRHYKMLRPWICALPTADLSPVNVNTLLPEQAPLLAMLVPSRFDVDLARAQIAARPAAGYSSVLEFWRSSRMSGLEPSPQAAQQLQVRTSFFRLRARVRSGRLEAAATALIDARTPRARIVSRSFADEV